MIAVICQVTVVLASGIRLRLVIEGAATEKCPFCDDKVAVMLLS